MTKKVTSVEAIPPSTLRLFFADLRSADIDMAGMMALEAFAPLLDPDYFRRAELDEIGGVVWPNGADLSPEWLAEQAGTPV